MNTLVIENKKILEIKEDEIKNSELMNDRFIEDIRSLTEKEALLEKEKNKLEIDLDELLSECSRMKKDFEQQVTEIIQAKDKEIVELKKKPSENDYAEKLVILIIHGVL